MTIQIVDKVVSAYKRWSHFVLPFQKIQQELQKPSKSAGKRGIPSHYPGQFFQVYTCECKRGFHFHPCFTNHTLGFFIIPAPGKLCFYRMLLPYTTLYQPEQLTGRHPLPA